LARAASSPAWGDLLIYKRTIMKQKILSLIIAVAIGACCHSQCDKKIILSATGAEIWNEQNEVKIKDTLRVTTVKYDSKVIEIVSEFSTIYGTIDSIYCNWKLPFKEGNTYIKGMFNNENGDQWVAKLTINGKDGKLTLLVDIEHPEANKMRFVLDKFEESK
jgi:major membrane immunogen (membrane-anchored lipoprotein)